MTNEPKPRVEVREETQERLEILELERTPRPEKLARERALLEGASEVRFVEREFRPASRATLDDVRRRVDAMQLPARARLPDAPPLPPPPAPIVVPKPVSDEHQAALAPVVKGKLLAVERVYEGDAGEVVDATWETPEGSASAQFVIEAGKARPVDDISKRVDDLPAPVARAPSPEPPAMPPAPVPVEEKKRKLGFPKMGRKEKAATPEPEPPADASDEPKKRRFGFGRK